MAAVAAREKGAQQHIPKEWPEHADSGVAGRWQTTASFTHSGVQRAFRGAGVIGVDYSGLGAYESGCSVNLIVGIVVVFVCVIGGFVVHGGKVLALWQPSELVIIGGAAAGGFLIANGFTVAKKVLGGLSGLFKGAKYKK